jgi:hypothetical protein
MIDIEKLKAVKKLVTHANCPDGIASALIIKDALPEVEVVFMAHGTEAHKKLEPRPGTLFVDFSPFQDQWEGSLHAAKRWIEAGAIVLDHHPTQRDVTMAFVEAGLGNYGENDKNECGAWLAYEHVWRPIKLGHGPFNPHDDGESVKQLAELAGVRDTWKKDDPRWQAACEQAEELMFWGFDSLDLDSITDPRAISLGSKLFEKKIEHAKKAIGEAHEFTTQKGTGVVMFQGVTPTSDAAEILEKDWDPIYRTGVLDFPPNIVAGFHYKVDGDKLKLQFSTRSHTGYDVGAFCKSRGGGGHSAAAGFTIEQSPEVGINPYACFKLLLEEWEQGQ